MSMGRKTEDEAAGLEPRGRATAGAARDAEASAAVLSLKGSFGTAVGAAMLGFEEAVRDGPPPQIQAAEQMPDPHAVTVAGRLRIEFPIAPEKAGDEAG